MRIQDIRMIDPLYALRNQAEGVLDLYKQGQDRLNFRRHYCTVRAIGVAVPEILHSGQSQFTDMVGGKPLGLTVCWINRRGIDLHPSVPPPDHIFPDIRSLLQLLGI